MLNLGKHIKTKEETSTCQSQSLVGISSLKWPQFRALLPLRVYKSQLSLHYWQGTWLEGGKSSKSRLGLRGVCKILQAQSQTLCQGGPLCQWQDMIRHNDDDIAFKVHICDLTFPLKVVLNSRYCVGTMLPHSTMMQQTDWIRWFGFDMLTAYMCMPLYISWNPMTVLAFWILTLRYHTS